MALIKRYENKRNNAFEKLQNIYDLSLRISDPAIKDIFLIKAKSIALIRHDFVDALEKYHDANIETNENYIANYSNLDAFDDVYDKIQSLFMSLEEKRKLKRERSDSNSCVNKADTDSIARLPKLSIPDFDGKMENWPIFYQLFKRLVHENKSLTDLERINYLVTHLKGTARSICTGILPTEENYRSLFKSLIDRYDDKRALASTYLDKLLNFKPLSQESEKGLHLFLENFVEATVGLKQLNLPDLTDFILTHIAIKKLDSATIKQFEMSIRDQDIPRFDALVVFIKEQAKILGRTQKPTNSKTTGSQGNTYEKKALSFVTHQPNNSEQFTKNNKSQVFTPNCSLCSDKKHPFYLCSVFRSFTVPERWNIIKRNGACFNCLSPDLHRVSSCKSKHYCSKCKSKHHTLLHNPSLISHEVSGKSDNNKAENNIQQSSFKSSANSNSDSKQVDSLVHHTAYENARPHSTVLLATATVNVIDTIGNIHYVRALIDPGSQLNFLTSEAASMLGLKGNSADFIIKGFGNCQTRAQSIAKLRFSSRHHPFISYEINAVVVNKITDDLPIAFISSKHLTYLENISLADETYHTPNKIHMLLGAEIWAEIVGSRKIYGPPNTPTAIESTLGYLLIGRAPTQDASCVQYNLCTYQDQLLNNSISKFWELEEVPHASRLTPEEKQCEELFVKTCKRLSTGRFSVSLPFKSEPSLLGSSKESCIAKLFSLERRLRKDPRLHFHYNKIIEEYLQNGYVSLVTETGEEDMEYYMPHHEVLKPESLTTPVRIVFNASARTTSGRSLNELLHVGPKLQSNICEVLLNFRLFAFAVTADISKMYLQVFVQSDHRKFQRFLWRSLSQNEIQTYEFNTVVFGMSSSPYLAQRVIRELATRERDKYPFAAEVVLRDMYIDDLVSSVSTEFKASDLLSDITVMLQSGGFHLAKWQTNSSKLNASLKADQIQEEVEFNKEDTKKVLGIRWLPKEDSFTFKVFTSDVCYTKRSVLSSIAKIFDPLGLLAPVLIYAKLIMKDLWINNLDWDETLPEAILHRWNHFQDELELLVRIRIPRHVSVNEDSITYLVGFSDASEKAYGATVYLVVQSANSGNKVNLLCAKSKIAPLKTISIPRLELCASLMLSKLLNHVRQLYKDRHQFTRVFAYTDSSVVLHWIAASPSNWKVFVANRVSQLQENLPFEHWRHVKSEENPADCLSRGLLPSALLENSTWFSGPEWLSMSPESWPNSVAEASASGQDLELKTTCLVTTYQVSDFDVLLERSSTILKVLRSTAYALRFIHRRRPSSITITAEEVDTAETMWLKLTQRQHFGDVYTALEKCTNPPRLQSLDLFLHEDLIRVGGRLSNADIKFGHKHPVLLPKKGKFVELLIEHCHRMNAHAGPHFVFYFMRHNYWILSARSIIRQRIRKCNICFKTSPKPIFPKMAPLPDSRVRQQIKAFTRTGVDYAGPFSIVMTRRRGGRPQKAYICLFVCLTVKAIHLELVSDLTTVQFLNAFKRFLSRRGPCLYIQSDCGSNFIGAKKELNELKDFITSQAYSRALEEDLSAHRIQWKFNPPAAPHFGGIWEANVKVVKTHLSRVIGLQLLTYEEFQTVLVQIEAVMNSRPLCVLSDDVSSPSALTPAHFLTFGSSLAHFPASDVSQQPLNHLSRYQLLDQMIQHYWKRWKEEYLQSLQLRLKWNTSTAPLAPGTVVVLMKENTAPLKWPIGVIEKVYPGKDGISRVVSVRTKDGSYRRPVVKVCPLPTQ